MTRIPFPPMHALDVWCATPWPKSSAYRPATADRLADERWHYLTYALKKGETWFDGNGNYQLDPAKEMARLAFAAKPPCFSIDWTLVPVPRSGLPSSFPPPASQWPGRALAEAIAHHTSQAVVFALQRTVQLPSSYTSGGHRNTIPQHVGSLAISGPLPNKIALVDDALVQGTQFAGAYEVLRAGGHKGDICGIAGGNTLGSPTDARAVGVSAVVKWFVGSNYASR